MFCTWQDLIPGAWKGGSLFRSLKETVQSHPWLFAACFHLNLPSQQGSSLADSSLKENSLCYMRFKHILGSLWAEGTLWVFGVVCPGCQGQFFWPLCGVGESRPWHWQSADNSWSASCFSPSDSIQCWWASPLIFIFFSSLPGCSAPSASAFLLPHG